MPRRTSFHIFTFLFLPSFSVPLPCFILAVPMRKCCCYHACMSSIFPVSILNGTLFFRSMKAIKIDTESYNTDSTKLTTEWTGEGAGG